MGYAFDASSIPYYGGDFMIPTGTRSTYSFGAQYHDKKQTLAVGLAWMNVGGLDFAGTPVMVILSPTHIPVVALPKSLLFPTNVVSNKFIKSAQQLVSE